MGHCAQWGVFLWGLLVIKFGVIGALLGVTAIAISFRAAYLVGGVPFYFGIAGRSCDDADNYLLSGKVD